MTMADVLPDLPLSEEVLTQIEHALGAALTYDSKGSPPDTCDLDEPRLVGAEFSLPNLLDFLAGHDHDNATLAGYSGTTPIYEAHDATYSERDLISALVTEVRRHRALTGEKP